MEKLGIGRARFFGLLSEYRDHPDEFSIGYARKSAPHKISAEIHEAILGELQKDKELIDNKDICIRHYNYSAIRDNLEKKGFTVSVPTIINRAKANG